MSMAARHNYGGQARGQGKGQNIAPIRRFPNFATVLAAVIRGGARRIRLAGPEDGRGRCREGR
eukprot:4741308-Pyramimonas_sp.AAC.1